MNVDGRICVGCEFLVRLIHEYGAAKHSNLP